MAINPTREVKTPKFLRTEGKTPAFSTEEVQKVLKSIDTSHVIGHRDKRSLRPTTFWQWLLLKSSSGEKKLARQNLFFRLVSPVLKDGLSMRDFAYSQEPPCHVTSSKKIIYKKEQHEYLDTLHN